MMEARNKIFNLSSKHEIMKDLIGRILSLSLFGYISIKDIVK